jgi:Glycosyl hydrolases family 31
VEGTPHYEGIARVMRLRENLREYVKATNAETATTGWPMVRAMILAFPQDLACSGADVEDQFMFGDKWLVAPQYTYQATSRSVYLPPLPANSTWVYFFNETDFGAGGARVDVPTPIAEFPLFYIRPVPILPPTTYNVTTMFSTDRGDTVLCLAAQCYEDNNNDMPGAYQQLVVEGFSQVDTGPMIVNGRPLNVTLLPLYLMYSFEHQDNYVSTNPTPPDSSYSASGGATVFGNGFALDAPAPAGALPLQIWLKKGAGSSQDYATVASPEGIAWVKAQGYTFVREDGGFILPLGWS